MRIDRFAKVFLDSDGNGDNYLEFHVNALNNIFDAWYKQGFTGGEWGNRFRFPDVAWECPGLLTATRIHGSINNPGDMDDGWSLEMAIPWKSLQSFTIGSCPPESGDIWGGHFGRVFRDQPGGKNTYWVWPFLAVENCHLPDRYGKIIFEDSTRKFERFFAWGAKADDDFMKQAADAGVTDLIVSPGLAANSKLGGLCQKYGINLYPVVTLAPSSWTKKYGDQQDAPLQQMDENEAKILAELQGEFHTETKPPTGSDFAPLPELQPAELQRKMPANMGRDNIKFQKAYQWGGEPIRKYLRSWGVNREALVCKGMLCFHHQAVKEVLYQKIDELLAIPGINGMAFDGIGYQNYHCCHCPESMRLYREYCQANHLEENRNSLDRFSMETLVEFQNELVDYVKSVKHDAVTVNHIWPVFLPEPLYGNRLNVDYCGQTAAWYFLWDPFRIANYSKIISAEQNKYFPEVKGVAFIGYYDSNQKAAFPCKSPERVDLELRAILRGGSNLLMMCGLPDLLANPDVAAVFKKFMQKKRTMKCRKK